AKLLAVPLGPEQVGAALVQRDDVVVRHVRRHPLLLAPDPAAVRPGGSLVAGVEEAGPGGRALLLELAKVVGDFQEGAAGGALVYDVGEWQLARTPVDALE